MKFFLVSLTLSLLLLTSCTEKETSIGVNLQDPATLFQGTTDTAYGVYYTCFDDSLLTSGQSQGLIGCYHDDFFGDAEAILFTQVAPPNNTGVVFDEFCQIDSIVLSLAVSEFYNANDNLSAKSFKNLHVEVYRLSEALLTDSAYYASDFLPISSDCLFNDVCRMPLGDTMVLSVKLNNLLLPYLTNRSYATAEDFIDAVKGLRIRILNDGNPNMATINLASSSTRMTVYYTYSSPNDTAIINRSYDFVIGSGVTHFNQFINNYSGALSLFNSSTSDSLDGSLYAYLCPMGGTNIKINFNSFVQQFHADHPYAIVHYAELILPVASVGDDVHPDMIAAFKCYNDGSVVSIPDLYDVYTYAGYDGTYDSDAGLYRIRVTQHFQKLLRSGKDLGTLLVVNSRRSSAAHAAINGYASANPIRLRFVYSE